MRRILVGFVLAQLMFGGCRKAAEGLGPNEVDVCGPLYSGPPIFGRRGVTGLGVLGDTVLLASRAGLGFYDVGDIQAPTRVGEFYDPLSVGGREVFLDGTTAIVRGDSSAVLLDVANPEAPIELHRFVESEPIDAVAIGGGRVSIQTQNMLRLYSIGGATSGPLLLDEVSIPREERCLRCPLAMGGDRIFVANIRDEFDRTLLTVFDIENNTLLEANSIIFDQGFRLNKVRANGARAVVLASKSLRFENRDQLHVVDANNATYASRVGQFELSNPRDVVFAGDFALTSHDESVNIYDVTYRTMVLDAIHLGNIKVPFIGVGTDTTVLTVAGYGEGGFARSDTFLKHIDLTDPENLRASESVTLPVPANFGDARDVAFFEDLLIVADSSGGIKTYAIDNAFDPVELGRLETEESIDKLFPHENGLWMKSHRGDWARLDLTDPKNPVRGDTLPSGSIILGARNEFLFLGVFRETSWIAVYDVSEEPKVVAEFQPTIDSSRPEHQHLRWHPDPFSGSFQILEDRLVTDFLGFRWVFDVRDPRNPVELSKYVAAEGETLIQGTAVNNVIVKDNGGVFDVSTASSSVYLGQVPGFKDPYATKVRGNALFFVTEVRDFLDQRTGAMYHAIDMSTPAEPKELYTVGPIDGPMPKGFDVKGKLAAIGTGERVFSLLGLACE